MYKRTILIVDDHNLNRMILGKLLSEEYNIMYACNGKEALECLNKHYDIISAVLLDIVMPVMNGYEVLAEMQKKANLSKIPVIVSSQKDGDNDEIKALTLGAQDYIAKPYKGDIIRHRLTNIIKLRETAAIINKTERDELTGLYNKHFFLQKVKEYIEQNVDKNYDLLCIGIEHFKLINDTYGVNCGDKVLNFVGSIIQEICDETKICGRFQSDTFYGLINHHEKYDNKIIKNWEDKINTYPIEMDIRVHCGIYEIVNLEMSISAMCDRAMLAANKNRGRYDEYFYIYDDSIREKLLEEQYIISHMQSALEKQEFVVYYQPKIDLTTEYIAGAEALVRWNSFEKGFMSPEKFIPIFEKNGFITQLDEYVWETACKDIRSWIERGNSPVAVSVNVSRADIYNPKLTDTLLGLVAKYQIPIKYLHLEITESAYTENPVQIINVVENLRRLGFLIEMDDFGSGYSSLNMLAEMPVDILKIDMGFIQSETKNTSGKGVLSFVISLAKWLNLAVVAEGAETRKQIETLRSMDCNYVQGYYYSKPVDKETFEKIIDKSTVTDMVSTKKTAVQYAMERRNKKVSVSDRVMLIVDDIEINSASLAATFVDDYKIVTKENGKTAWEYIDGNYEKIDIVMLDLLMPVMDGFQLLKMIRSDERTKNMPVIVTSQGDDDAERRVLEMNANDFISKPYNPEIIIHRVKNVIESFKYKQIINGLISKENIIKDASRIIENNKLNDELVLEDIEKRREYFDIVRLVDPRETIVYENSAGLKCDMTSCFNVWGKKSRCNNCTSLKAFENKTTLCKLEHNKNGLFFVISQFVLYESSGAVIEMVKKLDDTYVESILDKKILYANMDELTHQVEIDELTGVYNRRHLDNYLDKYINSAKRHKKDIGIAMIDIDHFKQLNDSFGHLLGDEALKQVAKILESNIAVSKGDFVSRFGGDEFVIVCMNIEPKIFANRMNTVSELIKHISFENSNVKISISGGCVSLSENTSRNITELIQIADKRLYEAKEAGRGRITSNLS